MSRAGFLGPIEVFSEITPDGPSSPRPYCSIISRETTRNTPIAIPTAAPGSCASSSTASSLTGHYTHTPMAEATSESPQVPMVILTGPTPASSPPPPPIYITSSPPKYAPLPLDTETELLLGPPPSFYEPQESRCDICIESEYACSHQQHRMQSRCDWVVRILILLNLIVWGMVVLSYWYQWDPDSWIGFDTITPGTGFV